MADKAKQVEFSPATPIPLVIDTKARIKELQGYLDPNNPEYKPERQHGKIDGIQRTTIIDGKVVPFEDVVKSKAAFWIEGTFFQQAQNYHIPTITTTVYQQPEVDTGS
ncbi:hypothetical protein VE04_06793 [Pseudogymnoascus sp. 24MN13]|nr:hypothetical protein VE04_06793 [Pseudogymnoascus sp. 24MN13]